MRTLQKIRADKVEPWTAIDFGRKEPELVSRVGVWTHATGRQTIDLEFDSGIILQGLEPSELLAEVVFNDD